MSEKFIASIFMIIHFSYTFWRAFNWFFFLSSLAAIDWEIEIPPPQKKFKNAKKNFFDRITSKFAGILEKPPSTYMKILVMMGLVGSLRTELSYRTHLLSRLQRTKLPSRKPTQDCNL